MAAGTATSWCGSSSSPARGRRGCWGPASKLDREPGFLRDLIEQGEQQATEFLTALAFENAWGRHDADGVAGFLADDAEAHSSAPFPERGPVRGRAEVHQFLLDHFASAVRMDLNHKQVVRDRVTWTARGQIEQGGAAVEGRCEVTFTGETVTHLQTRGRPVSIHPPSGRGEGLHPHDELTGRTRAAAPAFRRACRRARSSLAACSSGWSGTANRCGFRSTVTTARCSTSCGACCSSTRCALGGGPARNDQGPVGRVGAAADDRCDQNTVAERTAIDKATPGAADQPASSSGAGSSARPDPSTTAAGGSLRPDRRGPRGPGVRPTPHGRRGRRGSAGSTTSTRAERGTAADGMLGRLV